MRVSLQPSFILHTRPFRDTSLLVELLTEQYGRVSVLARGVRAPRAKNRALFSPFIPLLISWLGKTDLPTVQQIEATGISYNLSGKMLLSGFYINELLIRLLHRHDAHPQIFTIYKQALESLQTASDPEPILREFEMNLLDEIGYGLQLNLDINAVPVLAESNYIFEFGVGLSKTNIPIVGEFSGKSLLALHARKFFDIDELRDAKRLLRSVFAQLLGNKPLKSKELFTNIACKA